MKECTTHHHACECREAEYAKTIIDRQGEIGRLKISTSELEAGLYALKDAARAYMELNDYAAADHHEGVRNALAVLLEDK